MSLFWSVEESRKGFSCHGASDVGRQASADSAILGKAVMSEATS